MNKTLKTESICQIDVMKTEPIKQGLQETISKANKK